MDVKTEAILISYLKYGETSAIVRFFTQEKGFQALMWKGAFSSRNKNRSFLIPLSEVVILFRYKEQSSLQILKNIEPSKDSNLSPISLSQSTISLVASELLQNILQHEPENRELFQFLKDEMQEFKKSKHTQMWIQNLLLELTPFLGMMPQNNYQEAWLFNLESGNFGPLADVNTLNNEQSELWSNFLSEPKKDRNSQERIQILELLIQYFQTQISSFRSPKSIDIIKEVFSD